MDFVEKIYFAREHNLTANDINANMIFTLTWLSNAFVVRQNPLGTLNS